MLFSITSWVFVSPLPWFLFARQRSCGPSRPRPAVSHPPTPPDDSGQGYKGQAKYFHNTQNGIKEICPHCFFFARGAEKARELIHLSAFGLQNAERNELPFWLQNVLKISPPPSRLIT